MQNKDAAARPMYGLVFASSVGTIIEWYDFFLYGSLAIFFAKLFYPPQDGVAGTLISVATFATGFAVRPLGSLIFGHMGDRFGRKVTFLATLLIMGCSTAAIGFLPTYATAGYLAPVLLISLRIVQGLALGGEYGGAATYVAEHAPPHERGKWASYIQAMASGGFVLSLAMVLGLRLGLGEQSFGAWGWRLPFLVSIVLVGVSFRIRMRLHESPVFLDMQKNKQLSASPIRDAFTIPGNARRIVSFLFGVACAQAITFYTAQFYALYFLQSVMHVDFLSATLAVALGAVCGLPFFIVFGALSDRIGRKRLSLCGMAAAVVLYLPMFMLLRSAVHGTTIDFLPVAGTVFLLVVIAAMIYGPYGAFIVESFPPAVRYTSISIPYHIGNGIFGGFLPLIGLSLVNLTGNVFAGLLYPIAVCIVGFLVTLFFVPETLPVGGDRKRQAASLSALIPESGQEI
ncbi:sugar transporter [Gluconacetobacter liquefaciens NRIC 0522]|uniref:MHS family MFS transporter n=1 Tax=Gluconacetobacter liquefaciens TaxID=89584 RepID=A0A370G6I9_GLULI|nr:MFS transporter [Gluconacetobacter liquefaciens]MBB2185628.1 MHS family MFS transporter [Gluconacetobacter liquefaciens]RDI39432.1 putative MFS family arabinose efflux permease [Gluconacetobacter liquefaciens]GBR00296.1 sugar transporter [Gluconacetobacter liquefaciens NRIC 0522]